MFNTRSLVKETVEEPHRGLCAAVRKDVEHVTAWKEVHLWQVGNMEPVHTNSISHVCQYVKY